MRIKSAYIRKRKLEGQLRKIKRLQQKGFVFPDSMTNCFETALSNEKATIHNYWKHIG